MNVLILRKLIIGATGLFLCIFLVVHLSANLVLLLPAEQASHWYNAYAAFLANNLLIKVVAYLLYASILLHILYAFIILAKNRRARRVPYAVNRKLENSTWASQNMGLLGVMILLFLVVHLADFWAKAKLGIGGEVPLDAYGNKDLYILAEVLFDNLLYVTFYTLLMVPLGFHVFHGLKSAVKSLGLYHRKSLRRMERISLWFAWIVAGGFGIIPLIMYLKGLTL
ncbi:MAG: succinate dehydrogenase cytochrome b subunit [Bacteroidota bacterium]